MTFPNKPACVLLGDLHLVTTRPENLDGRQRQQLSRVCEYLPALRRLRGFVLQVDRLLDPEQSPHQAAWRRAALVRDAGSQADPDLAKALAMLTADKFATRAAYRRSPAGGRTGADEQPPGADQPAAAALRDGAVQVAATADDRAVRDPGRATLASPTDRQRSPGRQPRSQAHRTNSQDAGDLTQSRPARGLEKSLA